MEDLLYELQLARKLEDISTACAALLRFAAIQVESGATEQAQEAALGTAVQHYCDLYKLSAEHAQKLVATMLETWRAVPSPKTLEATETWGKAQMQRKKNETRNQGN